MSDKHLPPEALDDWADALADLLDLDRAVIDTDHVLRLAAVVANGVARPAAPLSAFAAGLAAGRSGGSVEAVADALDAVMARAEAWHDEG